MARRKRAFNRMPDAELIVMQGIWDSMKAGKKQVRASEVIEAYPETVGQQKLTTVLTLLSRLHERGYVSIEKCGRANVYSAQITEEDYQKLACADFVSSVCRHSTGNLLSALVAGDLVADEDIRALRQMLEKEKTAEKEN